MSAFEEHRLEPREQVALPLQLRDGSRAVTRNISASGMYFEIAGALDAFGLMDFEMQLDDVRMRFKAVGEIVRVEHGAGTTGIAVKLLTPRLEPLD